MDIIWPISKSHFYVSHLCSLEIYSFSFLCNECNEVYEHMQWLRDLWWYHNTMITNIETQVLNILLCGIFEKDIELLRRRDRVVVEYHDHGSKQSPNLPILRIIHELMGIMLNKGWIHRELGKFLMISSNLIKSDDESIKKEDSKTIPRNQKSMNFTFISRRNWRLNRDYFSKNVKSKNSKLRMKLHKKYDSKTKLNAKWR